MSFPIKLNKPATLKLKIYYAYPFQRPERGGHFGMQFIPGL